MRYITNLAPFNSDTLTGWLVNLKSSQVKVPVECIDGDTTNPTRLQKPEKRDGEIKILQSRLIKFSDAVVRLLQWNADAEAIG